MSFVAAMDGAVDSSRITNELRRRGLKVTPQRLAICRLVLQSDDHPHAASIHAEVRKQFPTVSLATVYNVLHVMEEAGIVRELRPVRDQTRFDPRVQLHINMICRTCGTIVDCIDNDLQAKASEVNARAFVLDSIEGIDFYGKFRKCSRQAR